MACWDGTYIINYKPINTIQNKCVRIISICNTTDSAYPLYCSLKNTDQAPKIY